ncbi:hypothetical protein PG997_009068 [Apiospora hydei]|uniref:Uncharacterized protein n=1 Tax=Apiospora hydei TaxID=1337664 RepID=A0ABR1VW56_9PEZI
MEGTSSSADASQPQSSKLGWLLSQFGRIDDDDAEYNEVVLRVFEAEKQLEQAGRDLQVFRDEYADQHRVIGGMLDRLSENGVHVSAETAVADPPLLNGLVQAEGCNYKYADLELVRNEAAEKNRLALEALKAACEQEGIVVKERREVKLDDDDDDEEGEEEEYDSDVEGEEDDEEYDEDEDVEYETVFELTLPSQDERLQSLDLENASLSHEVSHWMVLFNELSEKHERTVEEAEQLREGNRAFEEENQRIRRLNGEFWTAERACLQRVAEQLRTENKALALDLAHAAEERERDHDWFVKTQAEYTDLTAKIRRQAEDAAAQHAKFRRLAQIEMGKGSEARQRLETALATAHRRLEAAETERLRLEENAKAQREGHERAVDGLQNELREKQHEFEQREDALKQKADLVRVQADEVTALTTELLASEEAHKSTSAQLEQAMAELETTGEHLEETEARLEGSEAAHEKTEAVHKATTTELEEARYQFALTQRDLKAARHQLKTAERRLEQSRQTSDDEFRAHAHIITTLKQRLASARREAEMDRTAMGRAAAEVRAARRAAEEQIAVWSWAVEELRADREAGDARIRTLDGQVGYLRWRVENEVESAAAAPSLARRLLQRRPQHQGQRGQGQGGSIEDVPPFRYAVELASAEDDEDEDEEKDEDDDLTLKDMPLPMSPAPVTVHEGDDTEVAAVENKHEEDETMPALVRCVSGSTLVANEDDEDEDADIVSNPEDDVCSVSSGSD